MMLIREIQIKTTMEITLNTFRMTKEQKNLIIPSAAEDAEQMELSYVADGNTKWYSSFRKQLGNFL